MYRHEKNLPIFFCTGCGNEIIDYEDIVLVPSLDENRTDLWHSGCADVAGIKCNKAIVRGQEVSHIDKDPAPE